MASPPSAVFVVGIICKEDLELEPYIEILDDEFGRRNSPSTSYPFDFTDFYQAEFGSPLTRHWFIYNGSMNSSSIRTRKLYSMSIEDRFRDDQSDRMFNIDVGYVTGAKFVLSSRKNYSNRIYLGDGVYAEVTLRYERGDWRAMPNTYSEYEQRQGWLDQARDFWLRNVSDQ